jgi:hypothetical protein
MDSYSTLLNQIHENWVSATSTEDSLLKSQQTLSGHINNLPIIPVGSNVSEALQNVWHESTLRPHIRYLKYILIMSSYPSNLNSEWHPRVNKTMSKVTTKYHI